MAAMNEYFREKGQEPFLQEMQGGEFFSVAYSMRVSAEDCD